MKHILTAAAVAMTIATPASADWQPPPRWHPMVHRNHLTGEATIYQPLPGNPYTRDYNAPTMRVRPDGTAYQTVPGNPYLRDWTMPPIDLGDSIDHGYEDE